MTNTIAAVDLFCGAGGTSTGMCEAAKELGIKLSLVAINHWNIAIRTHSANHPETKHLNCDIRNVNPNDVVGGGILPLLVASPECIHFSNARGGKPMSAQGRASISYLKRWIRKLNVENILIENVKEFQTWGPLYKSGSKRGRPIENRKGEYFNGFISWLKVQGYNVDYRVLNAADYGDATSRRRLFIQARKGKEIVWPEPTHTKKGDENNKQQWRAAREIIDWNLKGTSIFNRKKPLAQSTLNRIAAGLKKFGGKNAEPFLVVLQRHGSARSLDEPLGTITTSDSHFALAEPFLVNIDQTGGGGLGAKSLDEPIPTITCKGRTALVEPFLISYNGNDDAMRVNKPLPTLQTKERFGLVEFDGSIIDIRFRMLQPHELKRAMSFGDNYYFAGTKTQVVKQIGNAVPVKLAKALCMCLLKEYSQLQKAA